MGALDFSRLRIANIRRARRWHGAGFPREDNWSIADWSNAMCGEAGEAANVVKKIRRIQTDVTGAVDPEYPRLRAHLADELADLVTYADLVASKEGIDLGAAVVGKFNRISEREGLPDRL